MTLDISDYSYLWEQNNTEWALLHVNAQRIDEEPEYLVVNTENRLAKIIEDEVKMELVIAKMKECGVRIVSVGQGF